MFHSLKSLVQSTDAFSEQQIKKMYDMKIMKMNKIDSVTYNI